tara:strand:- start:434 stop:574 length:141 start_codon:yes stop_codon:yes gene_type:complete
MEAKQLVGQNQEPMKDFMLIMVLQAEMVEQVDLLNSSVPKFNQHFA